MPAEGRGPDLRQASKVTRPRRLADGPATPLERVRTLQSSLQAKAKAEPAFRFYALWDKVCRADVLDEAYRACRRNGGAPGCDGETFDQIASHGLERWLGELRQELRAGEYRPQPLLRVGWCDAADKQAPDTASIRTSISTRRSACMPCRVVAPTCRARRLDDAGESRMRVICMSGLTSGDWKRSYASPD
jgi:hypothetical protein